MRGLNSEHTKCICKVVYLIYLFSIKPQHNFHVYPREISLPIFQKD